MCVCAGGDLEAVICPVLAHGDALAAAAAAAAAPETAAPIPVECGVGLGGKEALGDGASRCSMLVECADLEVCLLEFVHGGGVGLRS